MIRLRGWMAVFVGLVFLSGPSVWAQDSTKEKPKAPVKAKLGKPAPDFTLKDLKGKEVRLSRFKGKIVVLEWFNPTCPSVVTAHGKKGSLKSLPTKHIKKNKVVWLAINSGKPGTEGTGLTTNKKYVRKYRMKYPVLLDESGSVGRMFKATMTPEILIIDPKGVWVYRGAEDNRPKVNSGATTQYVNYVDQVIDAIKNGKKIPYSETKPGG